MGFVEDFEKYCFELESPDSYIRWASFSTIAAILRNNVYITFTHEKIYPNIYVLLYATSAATRKGAPLKIAGSLIREIDNTKFLGGRLSVQAAMKDLVEVSRDSKGNAIKGGSCVLYSEEISALFAGDGESTINILTDWYDYYGVWHNRILSNDGIQEIHELCVNILAASNDVLFKKVFTSSAIWGGLLARIFLIVESKKRKTNSRMYPGDDIAHEREKLVKHLRRLATLHGTIIPTEDARECYHNWYCGLDDSKADSAGVFHRMHTGVIKLALILAASEYNFNMIVDRHHVERAIDLCSGLLKNYRVVTGAQGQTKLAKPTQEVLNVLTKDANPKGLDRQTIIRRLFGVVDVEDIEKVLSALGTAEFVEIHNSRYKLTERFRQMYIHEEEKVKEKEKGTTV